LIDQIDEIRADFPWWDDLNPMWREMPKYATHLISNSGAGADQFTRNLEQLNSSNSMHATDDLDGGSAPVEPSEGFGIGEDQDQEETKENQAEVIPWVQVTLI